MENELKEWQDLWQDQKLTHPDARDVIQRLAKVDRRDKIERWILVLVFPLTIFLLFSVLPNWDSIYYLIGISLMAIGMLMIIYLNFKNKFDKMPDVAVLNSKSFLKSQIEKLNAKIRITSKYMWVYAFFILAGINVAYLEALSPLSIPIRLAMHFFVTIPMIIGMYFGIKGRMKKYEKDVKPLIRDLRILESEA